MHIRFFGILVYALFLPIITSFFTAPVSTVWNYPRRSLTCSRQTDTLYNGQISHSGDTDAMGYDYCLIAVSTSLVNNLNKTVIFRDGIWLWNWYRNRAINQCNFSKIMDIGYENCIPYDYDTATSMELCICSTNNCTDTYLSCQASVNQALSSPPPLLPVLQPTLSNTISCQDYYVDYSTTHNITPVMYLGCDYLVTVDTPDYSKCYNYTPTHTVMCFVMYDSNDGDSQQMALIEGDYEPLMWNTIITGAYASNTSLSIYQYQTSTSIATIFFNSSTQYVEAWCLCTTDNCNIDFRTCTNGMDIPSYILPSNGSSSSTTSTGSISTGSTNVTLSPLTTIAGTSVGSNSTMHNNSTSISISIKCHRSLIATTLLVVLLIASLI